MSRIEAAEIRSLTGKNCHNLVQDFNVDPWSSSPCQYEVSNAESWELPLLQQRCEIDAFGKDTEIVERLIDSRWCMAAWLFPYKPLLLLWVSPPINWLVKYLLMSFHPPPPSNITSIQIGGNIFYVMKVTVLFHFVKYNFQFWTELNSNENCSWYSELCWQTALETTHWH